MRRLFFIFLSALLLTSCGQSKPQAGTNQEKKPSTVQPPRPDPTPIRDEGPPHQPPEPSQVSNNSDNVGWYVHLQRFFNPYNKSITQQIENSYQKNPQGHSEEFFVVINDKSSCYKIDFAKLLQIDCKDPSKYRKVRRIEYLRALTPSEQNAKLPLTFEQIIKVGGHPENYLTPEELSQKKVKNENDANFMPLKSIVKTDSL